LIVVYESLNNGWLSGSLKNKYGIFPASYVESTDGSAPPTPSSVPTVTALYDYDSGVPDDLKFRAGDKIEVVAEMSSDWLKGRLNGNIGLVPITYISRN
jgi:hypothetical protein